MDVRYRVPIRSPQVRHLHVHVPVFNRDDGLVGRFPRFQVEARVKVVGSELTNVSTQGGGDG